MSNVLIDTCIFIDVLRGRDVAIAYLGSLESVPLVSALTCAELYAGARDKKEEAAIETLLNQTQIIPISATIAVHGGKLRKQYGASHNTGLMDALMAATAMEEKASVVTLNRKHFPMIEVIKPYN